MHPPPAVPVPLAPNAFYYPPVSLPTPPPSAAPSSRSYQPPAAPYPKIISNHDGKMLKMEVMNCLDENPIIEKFTGKNFGEESVSNVSQTQTMLKAMLEDPNNVAGRALFNEIYGKMSTLKYYMIRYNERSGGHDPYYLLITKLKFRPYRKLKSRKSVKKSRKSVKKSRKTSKQNVSKRSRNKSRKY